MLKIWIEAIRINLMIIKTILFTFLSVSFLFLYGCSSCFDRDTESNPDGAATINYELAVTIKGSVDINEVNENNKTLPLPIPVGDSEVEITSDNLVVASIIQRSDLLTSADLVGRSDFFKNGTIDENSGSVLSHTLVSTDGSFNLQVPTGVMFYMVVAYKESSPQFHLKQIKNEEANQDILLIDTGEAIYPIGQINSSTASGETAMLTFPKNTDITSVDVGVCSLGDDGFLTAISAYSYLDSDSDGISDDLDPDSDGNGTPDSEETINILANGDNLYLLEFTKEEEKSYDISLSQQNTSVTYYTSLPSSCSFIDNGDSTGTLTCNFSSNGSFQASFIAKIKEVNLLSSVGVGDEKYTYAYADYLLSVSADSVSDDDENGGGDSSGDGSGEYTIISASDASSYGNIGSSVAIDGNYAIMGGVNQSTSIGAVYIFKQSDSSWSEQSKLSASDGFSGDNFSYSVSIDEAFGLAVVGAPATLSPSNTGNAYVYALNESAWSQTTKLTGSDSAADDLFGNSVSISGDTIIVGAEQNSSRKGAAYVFVKNGSNWDEQAKLTASNGETYKKFGSSVGIDGDYAIVGASGAYSAYIFKRDSGLWSEQKILSNTDETGFGRQVAISGDYAIAGGFGKSYIYFRSGTDWSLQATLTVDDTSSVTPVGINGDYAIAGDPGKAHIFKRTDTSWSEISEKTSSSTRFGLSVGITSGNYIIGDSLKKINSKTNTGAAYIYPY